MLNELNEEETRTYELLSACAAPYFDDVIFRFRLNPNTLPPVDRESPKSVASAIMRQLKQQEGPALAELEEVLLAHLGKPLPPYWFTLSFAREEPAPSRKRFFDDLQRKLRKLRPDLRENCLGYLDPSSSSEPRWSPWVVRALKKSRVLVCLYSRAFFQSEICGKEWRLFQERQDEWLLALPPGTARPPVILPILWDPPDDKAILPLAAREATPYQHQDFGKDYAEKGLRFLVQQVMAFRDEFKPAYEQFLERFAAQLLKAMDGYSLAAGPPVRPLSEVVSAFPPLVEDEDRREQQGPEYVYFVCVAGRKEELANLRKVECYGDTGEDWQPFHPGLAETVLTLAQSAARMVPDVTDRLLPLKDTLVEELRGMERKQNMVLLLVDSWSILLRSYGPLMRAYDEAQLSNSAVLIPWNPEDLDTKANPNLRDKVIGTFQHKASAEGPPERFRFPIETVTEFRTQLTQTLAWIRKQLRPVRVAGDPMAVTKPLLRASSQVMEEPDHPVVVPLSEHGQPRRAEGVHWIEQPILRTPLGGAA
jgi:FxsC-like protein